MAYTSIPMDFSQSGIVQQENYPHQQVYADFASPFGHQAMPVYTDYPDMYHPHADPSTVHATQDSAFWHVQGTNSTTATKGQLGSNGKPKRRRTATQAQRRAANVRERRRMFNLNESFDQLRTRVPTFAYEKRLSRIETLRLAITYISFLNQLIDGVKPDDVQLLAMPKASDMSRVRRALGVKEKDIDYYDCLPSDSNSES